MARTELFSRKQPGGVYTINREDLCTGDIYFVNSATGTNGSGYGNNPDAPLATVAYALANKVTAGQNDIVYVMPGHTEDLASAAAIANDKAGVSVIGLGNGANRPLFTWKTSTAATWTISAASVTLKNFRVKTTIDELVKMFSSSAAYLTIDNVEFVDNASAQAQCFLLTTAASDYLTVKNCFHYQSTAPASASSWIELVGCDCARIIDNVFFVALASNSSSFIINGSTAVVMCEIARNQFLHDLGGSTATKIVTLASSSTGLIHDNRAGSGTGVSTAGAFDIASAFAAENYWADTVLKSGLLAPVVDTDT